jgi:hypothetical protein
MKNKMAPVRFPQNIDEMIDEFTLQVNNAVL